MGDVGEETSTFSLLHTRVHVQSHTNTTRNEVIGENNTCIGNLIAPELFVLGAPKSGTTTLWRRLKASEVVFRPVLSGEKHNYKKEPNIFNNHERFDKGEHWWLESYNTSCNRAKRIVAADMTQGYLSSSDTVPDRILSRYGNASH